MGGQRLTSRRKTGGPASPRDGLDRGGKMSSSPVFDPLTIQTVASRYKD